ncbi:hypothetical protein COD21_17565 [Bacillus cereus]|nr:hypothetical protein COD21_17565 [Bacillus cereus]
MTGLYTKKYNKVVMKTGKQIMTNSLSAFYCIFSRKLQHKNIEQVIVRVFLNSDHFDIMIV